MAQINAASITDTAKQRFQALSLPAGVDRNSHLNYIAGICSAIARAWNMWQSQATLTQVNIHGPMASGGRLSGPGLSASWAVARCRPMGRLSYTSARWSAASAP